MDKSFWPGLACGLLVAALVMLFLSDWANGRYRQGQIDAINGVIKYELREHDDGSNKWEALRTPDKE